MAKEQSTRARNKASSARMVEAQAKTAEIVATGKCPMCKSGLRRNLAITGWWQCEQLGSVGFRKDASRPACTWQGFTA